MDPDTRARGILAYSSGNHAQGVARAAQAFGVPAVIVMPADAPQSKIDGTKAFGAEVVTYDRETQNREDIGSTREKLAQQESDFNAAAEALDQLNRLIIEKENQLERAIESTNTTRAERHQLEAQLRDNRNEASRSQTAIAALQAKIESAISQLEGNRERARQLADEEQRLNLELEEFKAERSRIAEYLARSMESGARSMKSVSTLSRKRSTSSTRVGWSFHSS